MERIIGQPSPDPLILINFPDINTQFKVHVLEDSRKIKITLARVAGRGEAAASAGCAAGVSAARWRC